MNKNNKRGKQGVKESDGITVGVDECGVGPLAGPVVAAAVIIGSDFEREWIENRYGKIRDSKKTPKDQISNIAKKIKASCKCAIAMVEAKDIDKLGIKEATFQAMTVALQELRKQGLITAEVIVDGKYKIPGTNGNHNAVVSADSTFYCVAAASIIAKDFRDKYMIEISRTYPEYGFHKHKGYATKEHLQAIKNNGLSPIHRKSFKQSKKGKK